MSDNLKKLRVLTENLTIRDTRRLQELSLYQSFFEAIPVRTFVWSVDKGLKIRVKNKKSLKGDCSKTVLPNGSLKDAFSCPKMNALNIQMHKEALSGKKKTYLSYEGDITFLTTLLPVKDGKGTVVYGCSWDVTNLLKISEAVEALAAHDPGLANSLVDIVDQSPVIKLINELRGHDV